jgi:hypothetical protein
VCGIGGIGMFDKLNLQFFSEDDPQDQQINPQDEQQDQQIESKKIEMLRKNCKNGLKVKPTKSLKKL